MQKGFSAVSGARRALFAANPSAGATLTLGGVSVSFGPAGDVAIGATLADTLDNLVTFINASAAHVVYVVRKESGVGAANLSVVFIPRAFGASLVYASSSSNVTFSTVDYFVMGADNTKFAAAYVPLLRQAKSYHVTVGGGTNDTFNGRTLTVSYGTGQNGQEVSLSALLAAAQNIYTLLGGSGTAFTAYGAVPSSGPYMKFALNGAGAVVTVAVYAEDTPGT